MMFPGEMIINIDPKEFSYVRLLKGFISKGERNAGVKFLLSGFKNYVVSFLYISYNLVAEESPSARYFQIHNVLQEHKVMMI